MLMYIFLGIVAALSLTTVVLFYLYTSKFYEVLSSKTTNASGTIGTDINLNKDELNYSYWGFFISQAIVIVVIGFLAMNHKPANLRGIR